MSSQANKSDRMNITGNCRVCNLLQTYFLPKMKKFDKNLEPLLTEKERMDFFCWKKWKLSK